MQIEILTIGNEILSGRTLDTNFAYLARALEAANVRVGWHTTVGDTNAVIGAAVRAAIDRADAVVMTGGLGPTPDDLTRKAVSTVLGRPLRLDEGVVATIRERAKRAGRRLPPSIETQALIPFGAQVWANRLGTAPGLLLLWLARPLYGGSLAAVIIAGLAGGAICLAGSLLAAVRPAELRRLHKLLPGARRA